MFFWLLTFYQTGPNGLFIFYQVFNLILQSAKLNWLKDFCKGIINWGQNESVIRSMALLPLIAAFLLLLWLDYITVLLSLIQLGFWLLTVFLILATCILLIFIINYVYDWCNIKKSK